MILDGVFSLFFANSVHINIWEMRVFPLNKGLNMIVSIFLSVPTDDLTNILVTVCDLDQTTLERLSVCFFC